MSRSPDYEIKVGRRVERGEKSFTTRVGVGFKNRAGGVNLLLDPGIALMGGEEVQITLWPWEPRGERAGREAPPSNDWASSSGPDDFADDVPF